MLNPDPSPLPSLSAPLIEALEKMFPPVIVTPSTTQNAVMYNAGQQSVIEVLRREYKKQIDNYTPRTR